MADELMAAERSPILQPEHAVIGRIPEWWLAAVDDALLLRAVRARNELVALWDDQPDSMVFPKWDALVWAGIQREHGGDLVAALEFAVAALKAIAEKSRLMESDPFRHGWEPLIWRKILLWMARKRLELPADVITFYVLGGKRSGKTDLGGKRAAQHTAAYERLKRIGQYVTWTWCVHQNESRSKDVGQKRVEHYLPGEWKERTIGKKQGGRLNYMDGSGFTANMFIVAQRLCGFVFSGMDNTVLQGPELTFAWLDEEQPPHLCKTVKERLSTRAAAAADPLHQEVVRQVKIKLERDLNAHLTVAEIAALHLGFCLHTFTPEEGWTAVVADALNGAVTIEEEDAEALPVYGPPSSDGALKPVIGQQKAPRIKSCRRPNEMIFYIWTQDNPFGGYEALRRLSEGMGEEQVRINLYGDVRKGWHGAFPNFDTVRHVVSLEQIPRELTVRRYVDAGQSKPMFVLWIGTARDGRDYVLNEWPREGDYIPGIGDPGAWAVPSVSHPPRMDGDPGPAQKPLGFGYPQYIEDWKRVELQLGAWYHAGVMAPFALDGEALKGHKPIEVYESEMDSRLGGAERPTTRGGTATMLDDFAELGEEFSPAAGDRLHEGDHKIRNALAERSDTPARGPGLFVARHCLALRFALENYTGRDGSKGACKDPRDALVFHLTNDDRGFVDAKKRGWSGGGSF